VAVQQQIGSYPSGSYASNPSTASGDYTHQVDDDDLAEQFGELTVNQGMPPEPDIREEQEAQCLSSCCVVAMSTRRKPAALWRYDGLKLIANTDDPALSQTHSTSQTQAQTQSYSYSNTQQPSSWHAQPQSIAYAQPTLSGYTQTTSAAYLQQPPIANSRSTSNAYAQSFPTGYAQQPSTRYAGQSSTSYGNPASANESQGQTAQDPLLREPVKDITEPSLYRKGVRAHGKIRATTEPNQSSHKLDKGNTPEEPMG
jgi:hypothetical protein